MVSKNLQVGTSHMLTFGGYVKVRESLYTQVIIQVNTILSQIDTRVILHRYESSSKIEIPSNTHTLMLSKSVKSSL